MDIKNYTSESDKIGYSTMNTMLLNKHCSHLKGLSVMKKNLLLFLVFLFVISCSKKIAAPSNQSYPVHKNITVTYFWIGEKANEDNDYIANIQSVWDDNWLVHYGGVDNPNKRNGYFPSEFTPKENPFYFALPYNDFNEDGIRKTDAKNVVYWANEQDWNDEESMCKNRWIKIIKDDKIAYAQWEDAGPFGEDDEDYVFGENQPANQINNNAGLDVSPAVKDFLNLKDVDKIDWRFVDFNDVPDGPWKKIITKSQIDWEN